MVFIYDHVFFYREWSRVGKYRVSHKQCINKPVKYRLQHDVWVNIDPRRGQKRGTTLRFQPSVMTVENEGSYQR